MAKIKPHKGGRTVRKDLRVTPTTNEHLATLANHKISLGDLVEEAVKTKLAELDCTNPPHAKRMKDESTNFL